MSNFTQAMKFISKWEWMDRADGAYTNDPKDPGGETKFGISKRANPQMDIYNLTLPAALNIYYVDYWQKWQLDSLEFPFSVAVFDCYVQHRPSVVQGWLKTCKDLQPLLETRRIFYLNLIGKDPSLLRFKNGWLARLNDLSKYVAILSQESQMLPKALNEGV